MNEHVESEANSADRSLTESQDDQIVNFDNIKSRLRPRNPVNYNQVIVHSSPSTPGRENPNTPGRGAGAKSVKRKINEESKRGNWSIFLFCKMFSVILMVSDILTTFHSQNIDH